MDTITDFDLGEDTLRFHDVLDSGEEEIFLDNVVLVANSGINADITLTTDTGTSITIEGVNSTGIFDSYSTLGDFLTANPAALNVEFDPDNFAS